MSAGRLVLGDLARDLPVALRDEVAAWTREDPLAPGVILVGSNLLALYLRRHLALAGVPHAGLRFVTFVDLARALAAPRIAALAPLPPGGRALIASRLARDAEYFAPVAARPGFRRRLAKTFGDLDDGGFADEAARVAASAAASAAAGDAARDAKVREVLRLYGAYRARIDGRFTTTSDVIRIGTAVAREARDDRGRDAGAEVARAIGSSRLAVYGFYDFTEIQRRLLDALARTTTLTAFALDPDRPGYEFARESVAFLEGLGLAPERGPHAAAAPRSAPALEILSAPTEVDEAREIARAILRFARDASVPFREMAILLRSPETYAGLIRDALDEAGIPFFLHQGLPLSETPAGKGFHLFLGLAGGPLDRASVIEFLTAAPLASRFETEANSPSLWDLVTKRAGIVEGREAWLTRLDRFAAADAPAAERRAAETLRDLVRPLFDGLAAFPPRASWARYAEIAERLLIAWIAPSPDREELAAAVADLARNDLVLDEPGVEETTLEEFRAALLDAMAASTRRIGRFGIDGVVVSDLLRARGLSFRVAFVPGLVERGFPAPPSQDPILLDRDRTALTATGAGRLAEGRARPREEELLFALARAAATDRVVLSYPRMEAGTTRERTPSAFVLRAAEERTGERVDLRALPDVPGFRRVPFASAGPADPDDALTPAERRVCAALRAPDAARGALARRFARDHDGLARALAQWDARWASGALDAHSGRLTARTVRELRTARPLLSEALSPSSMETYAICPYRYFLKNVLRLEQVPEPERIEEIEPTARGSLVHKILSRLFEELVAEKRVPLDAAGRARAEARMRAIAAEEFRAVEERGLAGYPLLWELKRVRVLAALVALLDFEVADAARLATVLLEAEFGVEGLASAQVALPGRRVLKFRGVVDRIDASPDGRRFRVTDYKVRETSAPRREKEEDPVFRGGEALQLPVYLLAAAALLAERRKATIADDERAGDARYLYLIVKGAKVEAEPIASDVLAARRADFETILGTIADGIDAGVFPVFPKEGKNCEWCDYRRVCGPASTVTRLYALKSRDERFTAFHTMKAIGAIAASAGDGAIAVDGDGGEEGA